MSKYKKQHFIPSSYLKAWCDPNCPKKQTPYVWRFSFDGKFSKKKAPENIFSETDMYTIKGPDGERNLTLEHGLQELESKFAKIRKIILSKRKNLSIEDHLIVCAFIAAMHSRTKAIRDHWKQNWEKPLKMMETMMERYKTTPPDELNKISSMSPPPSYDKNSISYEQIKELHENPLQNMMPKMIVSLTPRLGELNMAIFCTKKSPGFITSDYPCVWFDPEAYKRPFLYQTPGLLYPTIEITFPVSPKQCILLSRHNLKGYIDVADTVVDDLNRRTRFHADEYFIVNQNTKKTHWFKIIKKPSDI